MVDTAFVVSIGILSGNGFRIFFVSRDLKISGVVVVSRGILKPVGLVDKVLKVVFVALGLSRIRMNVGLCVDKSLLRGFVFML